MYALAYYDPTQELTIHDGAILLYAIPHVPIIGRYFLGYVDWRIP